MDQQQQACNISTCSTVTTYLSQTEVDAMLQVPHNNSVQDQAKISNVDCQDLDQAPSNEQIVNEWIQDATKHMQSIDTVTTLVTVVPTLPSCMVAATQEATREENAQDDDDDDDMDDLEDNTTHTTTSCWPVQIAGTSILSKWVSHCDLYVSSACRTVARLYRLVKYNYDENVDEFLTMPHCCSMYDEATWRDDYCKEEDVTTHLGFYNYNMPRYMLRSIIL